MEKQSTPETRYTLPAGMALGQTVWAMRWKQCREDGRPIVTLRRVVIVRVGRLGIECRTADKPNSTGAAWSPEHLWATADEAARGMMAIVAERVERERAKLDALETSAKALAEAMLREAAHTGRRK